MPALDTPWSAYGIARAGQVLGDYQRVSDKPILRSNDSYSYEDAVIWLEDDLFHLLCKDRTGAMSGHAGSGVYAFSHDGESWQLGKSREAYSRSIRWDDGRRTMQGSLERPQVLLQNGRVTHLFFATADGPGGFEAAKNTWNLCLPLSASNDELDG